MDPKRTVMLGEHEFHKSLAGESHRYNNIYDRNYAG